MQRDLSRYDVSILSTIKATAACHGKHYCYVSQKTIMEHLTDIYRITRARSTLNLHLQKLEAEGFFERVRRVVQDDNGRFHQWATLFKLKAKLFYLLAREVYLYAKELLRTGVRCFGRHKTSQGSVIKKDYPSLSPKDGKDPPFWSTKVGVEAFEHFKAFCQNL